jgi:2'-hydroxyisoflavone reductase
VNRLQQAGRHWDTVIDVTGYLPRTVRLSAEILKSNVGRYVYTSSISVYSNFSHHGAVRYS